MLLITGLSGAQATPVQFLLGPGPTRRDRSNIAVARFLNMPRRIAQERVPTASNFGSRDADMGDRWPARPIAINRQIPGPLVTVIQQRGRNSTRCRRFTSHLSLLTFHPLSRLSRTLFLRQSGTLTGLRAGCDGGNTGAQIVNGTKDPGRGAEAG